MARQRPPSIEQETSFERRHYSLMDRIQKGLESLKLASEALQTEFDDMGRAPEARLNSGRSLELVKKQMMTLLELRKEIDQGKVFTEDELESRIGAVIPQA